MVTSPNLTLTLESVPVSMAGAAGRAADRPADRCGDRHRGAATIRYHVLTDTGRDEPVAASDALLSATGVMRLALLMAVAELVRRRFHQLAPTPQA